MLQNLWQKMTQRVEPVARLLEHRLTLEDKKVTGHLSIERWTGLEFGSEANSAAGLGRTMSHKHTQV